MIIGFDITFNLYRCIIDLSCSKSLSIIHWLLIILICRIWRLWLLLRWWRIWIINTLWRLTLTGLEVVPLHGLNKLLEVVHIEVIIFVTLVAYMLPLTPTHWSHRVFHEIAVSIVVVLHNLIKWTIYYLSDRISMSDHK